MSMTNTGTPARIITSSTSTVTRPVFPLPVIPTITPCAQRQLHFSIVGEM